MKLVLLGFKASLESLDHDPSLVRKITRLNHTSLIPIPLLHSECRGMGHQRIENKMWIDLGFLGGLIHIN